MHGQPLDELAVLDVDRLVDRQVFPRALDAGGRGALAAADEALRVGRREEEDDVRDEGDRDEQERRPQQPSDEVPEH